MNGRTHAWTAVCCFFFLLLGVHAADAASSDSFTVTQAINTPDSEPPTIPGNLTATPVASSQIDLDWDASSDNIGVDGYQIFRDSSAIATTTLTSYSDTGLAASTTYSYTVRAFDAVLNYSTSTAPVATTTLAAPATTTPTTTDTDDGPTTATQLLRIRNLSYDATRNSISISFDTTLYAQATVRWGRTRSYEGGYTSSDRFSRSHGTVIDGLRAGTLYEIEVTAVDRSLRQEVRETFTVSTETGPDVTAPANVSDFFAALAGQEITLSWRNPDDVDLSHVRIVSSDRFYPTHEADGWLVYEGAGESARDTRTLAEGQRRYYTIFAYDEAENVSSGVVASVTRGSYVPAPSGPGEGIDTAPAGEDAVAPAPTFTFDDLVFVQGDEERPTVGKEVLLDADTVTVVSLPYELVPEHLKTIIVTLEHPEDPERVFSFLLRIDAQKSAYEARIGPLRTAGRYPVDITVFDYATSELFSVDGMAVVERPPLSAADRSDPTMIGRIAQQFKGPAAALLGVAVLLALLLIWRRKGKKHLQRVFTPRSLR